MLARGMSGRKPDMRGLTLHGFIDDGVVDKIRDSMTSKIWGSFTIFGNFVSGVIGKVIVVQLTK